LKELPKVYFERLLECSPDIVVAVDRKGTIIFYNDGAKQLLGYTAEEILGNPVSQVYPSVDEARRVMHALRSDENMVAGSIRNFECEFMNKTGERIPVALSGSIIYDERGREHGSIGFAKDIAELRIHEKMATMGQLAVGLAHEINNPLESLVNHAELLERYMRAKASQDDYQVEHDRIDAMKRELRHIQAIVERVGEMADAGNYGVVEYLPGKLMTDRLRSRRRRRADHRSGSLARQNHHRSRRRYRRMQFGSRHFDGRGLQHHHHAVRRRGVALPTRPRRRHGTERRGDAGHGRLRTIPGNQREVSDRAGGADDGLLLRQGPRAQTLESPRPLRCHLQKAHQTLPPSRTRRREVRLNV
jgi:PAS domain S-box-containing protein